MEEFTGLQQDISQTCYRKDRKAEKGSIEPVQLVNCNAGVGRKEAQLMHVLFVLHAILPLQDLTYVQTRPLPKRSNMCNNLKISMAKLNSSNLDLKLKRLLLL